MITPKDGSSLYYCLLWTEPDARDAFLRRLSLIHTLSNSLNDVQEPAVAEKKIHWWHEELERLAKSTPRHPSCVENQQSLGGNQIAIRHCLSILSSAASIRYTQSATDMEAETLLTTSYKARLALLADALQSPDPKRKERQSLTDPALQSDLLAAGFASFDSLYRLPYLLHRGFAVFSDETYARHELSPSVFTEQGSTPLLQEATATALSYFDKTFKNDVANAAFRSPEIMPIWRLAKLRHAQLKLWQRQSTELVFERATLTPIKKFYIAWRHRRS